MSIVIQMKNNNRRVFDQSSILVGSNPACDLCLEDANVHPQHARIRKMANRWMVESQGDWSLQVGDGEPGTTCWIRSGDTIRLSPNGPEIVFQPSDVPVPSSSETSERTTANPHSRRSDRPPSSKRPLTIGERDTTVEKPDPLPEAPATSDEPPPLPAPTAEDTPPPLPVSISTEDAPPPLPKTASVPQTPQVQSPPHPVQQPVTQIGSDDGTGQSHPVVAVKGRPPKSRLIGKQALQRNKNLMIGGGVCTVMIVVSLVGFIWMGGDGNETPDRIADDGGERAVGGERVVGGTFLFHKGSANGPNGPEEWSAYNLANSCEESPERLTGLHGAEITVTGYVSRTKTNVIEGQRHQGIVFIGGSELEVHCNSISVQEEPLTDLLDKTVTVKGQLFGERRRLGGRNQQFIFLEEGELINIAEPSPMIRDSRRFRRADVLHAIQSLAGNVEHASVAGEKFVCHFQAPLERWIFLFGEPVRFDDSSWMLRCTDGNLMLYGRTYTTVNGEVHLISMQASYQ